MRAVSTGMRISEILALKWRSVGLDRREAAVRPVQERLFGGLLEEAKRPLQMRA